MTAVILLPLPYKNPRRRKIIIHSMRPVGREDRYIDLKRCFVEYPVRVISVAVLVAVVKRRLFLLVFVALYNTRSISLFQ